VTEYLPISSTGHLLVTQRLLGITESEASNAFAICIQSGAIVAVLGIFRNRVAEAWAGLLTALRLREPHERGFRLLRNLVIAFLPAMILGVLLNDWIDAHLLHLRAVVIAWFAGGVAILIVDRWTSAFTHSPSRALKSVDEMSWQTALGIGLLQTVAMCPGTSRSLATILGGLLLGLSLASAVEFSFLLGVITLLAATSFKAIKSGAALLEQYDVATMMLGFVAAWVSAFLAVRWMLAFLSRHRMSLFGYYRMGAAILVGCCLYWGWLSA
jgi:undecaprenyl-diphosphatase